jgi:hypothetical protein
MIPENEKEIIMKEAEFLLGLGYELKTTDNYSVVYSNGKYEISAYYEKYGDHAGVNVFFPKENKSFPIGNIAVVRGIIEPGFISKLKNVLRLLAFVKDYYNKITDLNYCIESGRMVTEYLKGKGLPTSGYNSNDTETKNDDHEI